MIEIVLEKKVCRFKFLASLCNRSLEFYECDVSRKQWNYLLTPKISFSPKSKYLIQGSQNIEFSHLWLISEVSISNLNSWNIDWPLTNSEADWGPQGWFYKYKGPGVIRHEGYLYLNWSLGQQETEAISSQWSVWCCYRDYCYY